MYVTSQTVIITVGLATMAVIATADSPDLADMLPAELHGWKPGGPDGVYTAETLYDYIDGSAEVYRSFNVQTAVGRTYVKEGAPSIIVDLFDMGSSEDAYGAYHHDIREGSKAGIGQESELLAGSLSFWKDRYFVSIIPFDETDESKQAVLGLGTSIAAAIPKESAGPDIVDLLPEQGLLEQHIHYFHNHLCLNIYYYIADRDLLDLGRDTDGIIARYAMADDASRYVLLIVRYPSNRKARKAYKKFLAGYLPDADDDGTAQIEDGKWVGVRVVDNSVICVFDAPTRATIVEVTDKVTQLQIAMNAG